jgi:hypothetical protein
LNFYNSLIGVLLVLILALTLFLQVIEIAAPGRFNGHLSGALRVTDHVSE